MKTKKRRIIIGIIVGVVAVLVVCVALFLAGAWSMFGEKVTAAMTVEKLEDGLYTMCYEGDYGFDAYMEQGGAGSSEEMANYITSFLSNGFYSNDANKTTSVDFGCSTITVKDVAGNVCFGRNYDWDKCMTMIVHTKPENGYASISTSCLDFLGMGEDWVPDAGMMNKMIALAAVYVPLDGMNEMGLCIADLMAGDKEVTNQDTDKTDLTTTTAIRMILDRAATVDEAIELLKEIDMHSDIGMAHHLAICDATGRSVVIEYADNEMYVVETPIVTNHYLAKIEKQGTGSEQSHARFDLLTHLYDSANGIMSTDEVKSALADVAQSRFEREYEETVWSAVYEPEKRRIYFYFREQYEEPYLLEIKTASEK